MPRGGVVAHGSAKAKHPHTPFATHNEVPQLLEQLRGLIRRHGPCGYEELMDVMTASDLDKSGSLNHSEFKAAFLAFGVTLDDDAARALIDSIDKDWDGSVSYSELLTSLTGPHLPVGRRKLVWGVFDALDEDGSQELDVAEVSAKFQPQYSPHVVSGRMTEQESLKSIVHHLEAAASTSDPFAAKDGKVKKDEFSAYYLLLSAAMPNDSQFESMLKNCWGLSGQPQPRPPAKPRAPPTAMTPRPPRAPQSGSQRSSGSSTARPSTAGSRGARNPDSATVVPLSVFLPTTARSLVYRGTARPPAAAAGSLSPSPSPYSPASTRLKPGYTAAAHSFNPRATAMAIPGSSTPRPPPPRAKAAGNNYRVGTGLQQSTPPSTFRRFAFTGQSPQPAVGNSSNLTDHGGGGPARAIDLNGEVSLLQFSSGRTYSICGELGRGAFGCVYRVRCAPPVRGESSASEYALKILNISGQPQGTQEYGEQEAASVQLVALQELAVLSRLKHDNIVTYLDSSGLGGIGGWPNLLGIVMESCTGGTLTARLERGDRTWCEVNQWVNQLASALHYLHNQPKSDTTGGRGWATGGVNRTGRIVHGDIKSNNLLLTADGTLKLCDFGLAQHLPDGDADVGGGQRRRREAGHPDYSSPELFMGKTSSLTAADDLWATGCVLLEMVTCQMLYRRPWGNAGGAFCTNASGQVDTAISTAKRMSFAHGALAQLLLTPEPGKRLSASQLLALCLEGSGLQRNVSAFVEAMGAADAKQRFNSIETFRKPAPPAKKYSVTGFLAEHTGRSGQPAPSKPLIISIIVQAGSTPRSTLSVNVTLATTVASLKEFVSAQVPELSRSGERRRISMHLNGNCIDAHDGWDLRSFGLGDHATEMRAHFEARYI